MARGMRTVGLVTSAPKNTGRLPQMYNNATPAPSRATVAGGADPLAAASEGAWVTAITAIMAARTSWPTAIAVIVSHAIRCGARRTTTTATGRATANNGFEPAGSVI